MPSVVLVLQTDTWIIAIVLDDETVEQNTDMVCRIALARFNLIAAIESLLCAIVCDKKFAPI